jgi:hypothetical protein
VLSQAYTALEAEYVALKASQTDDSGYPQPFDVPYGRTANNHNNMGLNTRASGLDLDMFVYSGNGNTGYPM